jgi:hypothetical protein
MAEPSSDEGILTTREGYLAMYYFIDAYCKRGIGPDQLVLLWSDMLPLEDPERPDTLWTTDPALWSDWKLAIETARERGLPQEP